jgi:dienelactone hydrolase
LGQTVEVPTPKGPVRGVLYLVEDARGATIMVGGAGGGIHGPANSYEELAARLHQDGATALRLEYRRPNYLKECVYDVLAAVEALSQRGVERAVLVGWSFGGAVVISAGTASDAVVGVATVASQTYGTKDVGKLSPEKSLLLIHGTADTVLPYYLSQELYARADEPKELVLYSGDGHGIERHRSEMLDKLHEWSKGLLLPGTKD